MRKVMIMALLVMVALVGTGCTGKTPKDKIGLHYKAGPIEATEFEQIIDPGSELRWLGVADQLFEYPVTTRSYIISLDEAEGDVKGSDSVRATTSDDQEVEYQISVYFKLNTDTVQEFHEDVGLKYEAWTADGWANMLRDYFRPQIEATLVEQTRRYTVQQVFSDGDALDTLKDAIGTSLGTQVNRSLGGQFFCGPTFTGGECPEFRVVLKRPIVADQVRDAFQENRTSEIAVETRLNQVKQRRAEADAIRELNTALAQAGPAYVQLKQVEALQEAIESGQINFWVIPQDSNLTLPRGGGQSQ